MQNFLQAETRNDFFVSEKRKKIWKTQLGLLEELKRICIKYNLRYFAINGTLLGAVRHKGFIPWDDDFDVCMPRPDYEKLTKLAKEEFKYPIYLCNEFSEINIYRPYMRLRNAKTTAVPKKDWNRSDIQGIFIDIFPIDGVSLNKVVLFFNNIKLHVLNFLIENHVYYDYYKTHRVMRGLALCYTNYNYKKNRYNELLQKRRKLESVGNYEDDNKVCIITHGKRNVFEKAFFEPVNLEFENTTIVIPSGYDVILKKLYGNYMELPPITLRGQRHTIFFDPDASYEKYYKKMDFSEVEKDLNNY